MCDERELLIEYVYDECDAAQRGAVDRHLESCPTCREEIAGLRRTRQDLLAWEVPEHGSVWRPFAPARSRPWYREVPMWAYAAAAGIMFFIGVSGGVAAQALMRPAAQAPMQVPAQAAAVAPPANGAAIHAELTALEQKISLSTQSDINRLDEMVQAISVKQASSSGVVRAGDAGDRLELSRRLNNDFAGLLRRYKELDNRLKQVETLMATQAAVPGR